MPAAFAGQAGRPWPFPRRRSVAHIEPKGHHWLRAGDGTTIALELDRWRAEPDDIESVLLAGVPDPVLDIGCGPGRIVGAVAATGRLALGIDTSPVAVTEAERRGASVLCRSVHDPLPGERRWGSALLLDGNIGIGGDPLGLLHRVGELLRPGGQVVAEVLAQGAATEVLTVRVEGSRDVRPGPWFRWARVGADGFVGLATAAGLTGVGVDVAGDRWFGRAVRP